MNELHLDDGKRKYITLGEYNAKKGVPCAAGCGKLLNPAERMLGPICGKCVRRRHKAALN